MTRDRDLGLCRDCHINDRGAVCYCAMHNPDGTCDGFEPEQSDVSADLAPLSESDCAARGIRHSSSDDKSTALLDTDPDWLTRGMLGATARKTLEQC